MHSAVYGLAVLWEFVSGVSDVAQARRLGREDTHSQSSSPSSTEETHLSDESSGPWRASADSYGPQNNDTAGVTKSVAFSRTLKRQPNKRFVFRRIGAGEKGK